MQRLDRAGQPLADLALCIQALPDKQNLWKAASADMSDCAAVPALGWFESAASDESQVGNSTDADSLWIVLKFEGLQPAQGFAQPMPLQQQPRGGFRLFSMPEDEPLRRRKGFLRAMFAGAT